MLEIVATVAILPAVQVTVYIYDVINHEVLINKGFLRNTKQTLANDIIRVSYGGRTHELKLKNT